MGDGWLPSFCTAQDVADGITMIDHASADAGRTIDRGHFGALVAYTHGPIPEPFVDFIRTRRPDIDDPRDVIPQGHDGLHQRLGELVDAGATKFVVLPMVEPEVWQPELEALAEAVLPLQM
jgi:hypothetical protein